MLVFEVPLEGLLPLVLGPANGAVADVIPVHVLVGQEVLPVGKALAAGVAGVDGGRIVEALVRGAVVFASEAPVADGAGERLFSRVLPHVACKVGRPVGSVITHVAGETSLVIDGASGAVPFVVFVTRLFARASSPVHMEMSPAFPVFVPVVK